MESDKKLIEDLHLIDNDEEIEMTKWEANFLNNLFYYESIGKIQLTDRQREIVMQIINKYL